MDLFAGGSVIMDYGRVFWPVYLCGSVVQQTARPSSGQWTQLQRSSVPLSPPSWTFSLHDAPAKQIVSWRTPPNPSHSLFQLLPSGRRYRSIRARSARLLNSFSPRLREPWTPITPPLCETPYKAPTSWNMDHRTHPTSNLTTSWKKLWNFFVQFEVW